ncbi:MAG: hypothetical protein IJE63_06010, partial [Clostridia bacterium]|nr:hypothetical protein [Clostridia bacterium]
FGSTTQMIEAFKQRYGITPGKLRKADVVPKDGDMAVDARMFETLLSHATDFAVPVVNAKPMERVHYRVERPREGKRLKSGFFKLINVGFAKESYECLYNIYIMEEVQTILAVGAAGSTKLVNNATGKIERLFNYKFPYEYISRYDKMILKKDCIAEFFNNI